MDKARLAAFKAFKRIWDGAYSNLIAIGDGLTGIDRAFAVSIAIGTLERAVTLEHILASSLKKDTKSDVLCLLMTGLYQILYMDRVPDSAACDETVTIAKTLFGAKNGGFVNAVLRGICRSKEAVITSVDSLEPHVRFSANKELYELLESQYGKDTEAIFNAFFGKTETFLRVNPLKSNANEVAKQLNGVVINDSCVSVSAASDAVKYIDDGNYYIQGLASQKAVRLLDASRGQTVIDVCACPGGKSLGAALDMNNEGTIYSFDIHKNKLPLIEKSSKKLGISIISTDVQDARVARKELIGSADRVICDVPCSGTGVMGSKPEIKYKSPSDFSRLYETQREIIRSAATYLKPDGIMVYSTCSINKLENEDNVHAFLKDCKGFKLIREETCLPFNSEKEGFYMAKIKREY
ncbi:MAG: 16S rRNA (cytosine(967)-C(5))-methyltransferase RsmB [Clostridia bacterium]|nr:16S rRNA (cytosine(967)-C(5))-methyltransferase RsmB [Clostridia bacterium]